MTKKDRIKAIESKLRLAASITPEDCFSQHKRDHEMAVSTYTETVREVEKLRGYVPDSISYENWQKLLCKSNFGLGFGRGLLDMKNKTYRNRHRSFNDIESIVDVFGNACSLIKEEPLVPDHHLNLGNAFGSLGLAKEGKYMLEKSTYWDNITAYIQKK